MSVLSDRVTARRPIAIPLPPGWLVGWWAAGRIVVIAVAMAVRPAASTLSLWDGRWYQLVARNGYLLIPGHASDPAFFPLYPIVLRAVHSLGIGWEIAGPLISNLAFLPALALFYSLSRHMFDEHLARRATTYLAVFPLSYVFSMAYPESLVLALMAAAPLAAMQRRWWLAAACAAAASLGRPEAIFLVLPLAGIAWQQRRKLDTVERGTALAAVFAPLAGLVAYPLYLATVLHDPLAWERAQRAWHRSFRVTGLYAAVSRLPTRLSASPLFWRDVRDVGFFVLYLFLLYAAWRLGTPRLWLAAAVGIVVLPVCTGSFESDARFGLLAPPLFWGLAAVTRSTWRERVTQAASLLLLIVATAFITFIFP